jgi:hypothetical protein
MLTYQLHTRIFQIEGGGQFGFPNKCRIELKFAPGTTFGTEDAPSRTLVRAREASVIINSNTGRWVAQSRPPLERLEVTIESPESCFCLSGDTLKYDFQCASIEQLEGTLAAFKWVLPPLLNIGFSDPPIVEYARGRVGETAFRWEHKADEWRVHMRTVTPDRLEQHVAFAFEALPLFNGTANRRLAAALSYFHVATRLNVSGDSPWEFMAETILNYAKCLDILFVSSENTRDDLRKGLSALGYGNDEIEGDFVPITILRSWIDVAHPRVAIYKPSDLQVLYRYMALSEDKFRDLIRRVIDRVQNGTYVLPNREDLSLSSEQRKDMNRLVAQMRSRLGVLAEMLSNT